MPGGSMSQVVGLPNNSYKPITNTAWDRARLYNLQKGCTRLEAASDKIYQLLAHGRWFLPGTTACSITKTGRHDIAEILLKVVLKHQKSINQSIYTVYQLFSIRLSLTIGGGVKLVFRFKRQEYSQIHYCSRNKIDS